MTWKEAPNLWWLVSDSRLTTNSMRGTQRLSDRAAKILEVPAVLFQQKGNHHLGVAVKITTLGFAYAGSSLVALQAYAAVLPLWTRLQSSVSEELPSVEQFAQHLAKFVQAYSSETSSACECVLIGSDAATKTLDGWVISAKGVGSEMETSVYRIESPEEIHFFGSGTAEARERIELLRGGASSANWGREPLKLIRNILSQDNQIDVGGGVQLGFLTSDGFELTYDVQPQVVGYPIPKMSYRGFDLHDVGSVGNCFSILRGIA